MLQVTKPEGFGNIQLKEVPMPTMNARQVRVAANTTLISRGSELFRRYIMEEGGSTVNYGLLTHRCCRNRWDGSERLSGR